MELQFLDFFNNNYRVLSYLFDIKEKRDLNLALALYNYSVYEAHLDLPCREFHNINYIYYYNKYAEYDRRYKLLLINTINLN